MTFVPLKKTCVRLRAFWAVSILILAGCETLVLFFPPTTVTVLLVNDGSFPVSVDLFYSDVQEIPEFLLTEVGTEVNLTVGAGLSRTIIRDCDQFQAMIIDNADLKVLGSIGPEASTGILRDGDEFGCGDVITIRFSHSEAIVDFDVSTSIR